MMKAVTKYFIISTVLFFLTYITIHICAAIWGYDTIVPPILSFIMIFIIINIIVSLISFFVKFIRENF